MSLLDQKYKFARGHVFFQKVSGGEVSSPEISMPILPGNLLNHDRSFVIKCTKHLSKDQINGLLKTKYGFAKIIRTEHQEPHFNSDKTIREWAHGLQMFVPYGDLFWDELNVWAKESEPKILGWKSIMSKIFELPNVSSYLKFVEQERTGRSIFPKKEEMFNAMKKTPWDKVKVVIIGQDPYPTRGHAHGLAFSCLSGVPASLQNIYSEICQEYHNSKNWKYYFGNNGDLTAWAEQGVLLLNTVLSVREGVPDSHKDMGCETMVREIIKTLSEKKDGLVFMLWGNKAQQFIPYIEPKHLVLKSAHPSPMSANRGGWFGNGHFKACNEHLSKKGLDEIQWLPKMEQNELDDF